MCRFKSGIILKNKIVVAQGANDSHSDLLIELGITDDYLGATKTFVRAELVPENDKWWISPAEEPEKWKLVVDQDITPDWFAEAREEYEESFREAVGAWWEKHVFVDQKINELSRGYYRLKRCEVKKLPNDVVVMCDDSTVQRMYGNSMVQRMCGNSTVQVMCDNSTVQVMYDNSTVQEMCDNSTVQRMYDNSTVQRMRGNSTVQRMHDNSTVQEMYDNSTAKDYKKFPNIRILISEEGRFEMIVHENQKEDEE